MIIPEAAIKATAVRLARLWCDDTNLYGNTDFARHAIEAAMPAIEAAMRERIAQEIGARPTPYILSDVTARGYMLAIEDAARIARGGTP